MSRTGAPPPAQAEQAQALVRDGRSYFAQGEVERARQCFAAALRIAPHDQTARAGLDRCQRLLSESEMGSEDTAAKPVAAKRRRGSSRRSVPDRPEPMEPDSDIGPDAPTRADIQVDIEPEETMVDPLASRRVEAELERARETRAGLASSRGGAVGSEGDAGPDGWAAGPRVLHQAPGSSGSMPSFLTSTPAGGAGPSFGRVQNSGPGDGPGRPGPGHGPGPSVKSPAGPQLHQIPATGPQGLVAYPQRPPAGVDLYADFVGPLPPGYESEPVPRTVRGRHKPRTRPTRFWISLAAAIGMSCTALGLLIGALAFGRGDQTKGVRSSAKSAGPAGDDPSAAKSDVAAVAASRGSVDGQGARAMASRNALEARVNRIEHPVVAAAQAPTSGEVERVHVKAGGAVTTGQKLYTLREGKGARGVEAAVIAPAAGRVERRAARGDHVQKGEVLAQLVDPAVWLVGADLPSDEPNISWSCQLSTAEGRNRAPCRLESVQHMGGQNSRVTASVVSDVASWLQGGGQELLIAVSPPATGRASEKSSPDPASTAASTSRDAPSSDRPSSAASGTAAADSPATAPDSTGASRADPRSAQRMDAGPAE